MTASLLVPVDPERDTTVAVEAAAWLAARLRLAVRLLAVCPEASSASAARRLAGVADHVRGLGVESVSWGVVDGRSPAATIVEQADPASVAMICMGSRSAHGPLRRVVGSVAERVLADARVPVLTTGRRCAPTIGRIDRVVACWDGSGPANRAVAVADDLRTLLDAELTLLEVIADPARVLPATIRDGADLARVADSVHHPRPATVVVEGYSPAASIVEHLDGRLDTVAVIGTHGRRGLGSLVLGSVAERVLALARCPVVVVPPGAATTTLAPRPCDRVAV